MDTLGFEPRAFRMRSGCDTTTPCALCWAGLLYASMGSTIGQRERINYSQSITDCVMHSGHVDEAHCPLGPLMHFVQRHLLSGGDFSRFIGRVRHGIPDCNQEEKAISLCTSCISSHTSLSHAAPGVWLHIPVAFLALCSKVGRIIVFVSFVVEDTPYSGNNNGPGSEKVK